MNSGRLTLEQIRRAGLGALSRELGVVGMVRFLQQSETGYGNYSVERHSWLPKSNVRALTEQIRRRRGKAEGKGVELTAREREILNLMTGGATNQQIAEQLCLSTETVRWHVRRLYEKIGAKDRQDAARYAREVAGGSSREVGQKGTKNKWEARYGRPDDERSRRAR